MKPDRAERLGCAIVLAMFLLTVVGLSSYLIYYTELTSNDATPPLVGAVRPRLEPEAYFSPGPTNRQATIGLIGKAKRQIRLAGYGFTAKEIAEALVAAHERQVDVEVILDSGNATDRNSKMSLLKDAGIKVYLDEKHPIAHCKFLVVDSRWVLTGSANFTEASERNWENTVIIDSTALAAKYLTNWNEHVGHARPGD